MVPHFIQSVCVYCVSYTKVYVFPVFVRFHYLYHNCQCRQWEPKIVLTFSRSLHESLTTITSLPLLGSLTDVGKDIYII